MPLPIIFLNTASLDGLYECVVLEKKMECSLLCRSTNCLISPFSFILLKENKSRSVHNLWSAQIAYLGWLGYYAVVAGVPSLSSSLLFHSKHTLLAYSCSALCWWLCLLSLKLYRLLIITTQYTSCITSRSAINKVQVNGVHETFFGLCCNSEARR